MQSMRVSTSTPSTRDARWRRLAGFTLIEMIVVMGIIVMMASLMGPTLASMFSNRRLENAGTMVSSVLNEARNTAVTQKRRVAVVFCKDGLRTFREPKHGEPVDDFQYWTGELERYNVDGRAELEYDLHFAGRFYDELEEDLRMIIDDPSRGSDEWRPTSSDVVVWFERDGTVDFGEYKDIPTYEYNAEPVKGADVEIRMEGTSDICWVDIRVTGRTVSKVETPEEE